MDANSGFRVRNLYGAEWIKDTRWIHYEKLIQDVGLALSAIWIQDAGRIQDARIIKDESRMKEGFMVQERSRMQDGSKM